MEIDPTTRIIQSTQRYKGAPQSDQQITIPFVQKQKELVEFDRSVDLDLATVFDEERQQSFTFRPVAKFMLAFENALSGSTTYVPFRDNLYYTNAIENAKSFYPSGNVPSVPPLPINNNVSWDGFPQYPEFDFIRTDLDVAGYTIGNGRHIDFKSVSATTYNWSHYLSYCYDNDYNKNMYVIDPNTNVSWTWVASEGIPYIIINGTDQLVKFVTFQCPMVHGLSVGEFVQLSTNYNGNSFFQVTSLGDGASGSESYIFSIRNVGYTGSTFVSLSQGTFKRVLNVANSGDTISEYYVRRHKILTNSECAVLVNAGYEQNVYNNKQKCEVKSLTPNQKKRTSVKEGSRSYTLSFNCDVNTLELLDNQQRPISELYFTTIWRGYFGWTQKLKQGWYFNTYLDKGKPQIWWDQNNTDSNTTINQSQYTSLLGQGPFYYNDLLTSGDTIDGDFCEWNNFEQLERVISIYQHKITYNNNWFSLSATTLTANNQYGYFYQPHRTVQIRSFSDYIEEGSSTNVVGIPDYSYYSTTNALFRWRDLYPYGYIDTDGIGVDYPYLNDAHYPFLNTIFRITPENYNIPSDYAQIGAVPINTTTIAEPTVDECE
jgi:hypothetical protein